LGLTSHQRKLAAETARSGLLDLLMIRYNAAHRGAETDVFPVTDALGLPVVVYTCLRWGALMRSTPDDPPGFVPPRALAWYRFAPVRSGWPDNARGDGSRRHRCRREGAWRQRAARPARQPAGPARFQGAQGARPRLRRRRMPDLEPVPAAPAGTGEEIPPSA